MAGLMDEPMLSEHTEYLSDSHLLALLELGLEATLKEMKGVKANLDESPCNFLATWLMRNNPKHSAEGKIKLDRFEAELSGRQPLANLADLEDRQAAEAAVRLQSASRGHAARLMAGEQKKSKREQKAAVAMQASARGRAARKDIEEQNAAAAQVQAVMRGKADRKLAEQQREQERLAQETAATAVQSVIRGRQVRSAPPGGRTPRPEGEEGMGEEGTSMGEEGMGDEGLGDAAEYDEAEMAAATRMQSVQRGRIRRKEREAEDAAMGAAVTKVASVQRGRSARRELEQEAQAQAAAATKLQSIQRSRMARQQ